MNIAENLIFICLLKGVCCRDFYISLPEKIQALSGSCVIIKCRFEINETYDKDLTERAIGVWLKNWPYGNNNLVFNSRTSVQNSGIKGEIIGKLKDKDCTTVFHEVRSTESGPYYFRIEGEGQLQWTFAQNNVSIDVIESPVSPRIELYAELQDQQEVLEWSSVSLRCSAETLCSSLPPTLSWSSSPRIPLSESSRRQELISDLNFTAAQRHHTHTFTCTVTYQLQERNRTAHSSITLHVQYAPKISLSTRCIRTDVPLCFCEVDGNPPPEVEWHLSGRPVSNSPNMSISEELLGSTRLRSFITFHQSLSHTSTLECVANNTHGSKRRSIQLNLFFQEASWFNMHSFLVGAVVGAVLGILCVSVLMCKRICRTQGNGLNGTNGADSQDNGGEPFYINKVIMSSAGDAKLGSS